MLLFAAGVAATVKGAERMLDGMEKKEFADGLMQESTELYEGAQATSETYVATAEYNIKELDRKELEILASFDVFSDCMMKIQKRPEFKKIVPQNAILPKFSLEEIKTVSKGAGSLITTAGAFGGMSLGLAVAGSVPLGLGILIGGKAYNKAMDKRLSKVWEITEQMFAAQDKMAEINEYLEELIDLSDQFLDALLIIHQKYSNSVAQLEQIVHQKTNWKKFSLEEKTITQNTILLVGILYKMCQVSLVKKGTGEDEINQVESEKVKGIIAECSQCVETEVKEVEINNRKQIAENSCVEKTNQRDERKIQSPAVKDHINKISKKLLDIPEDFYLFLYVDMFDLDLYNDTEYTSKSACRSAAEKQLKKTFDKIKTVLDPSSKESIVYQASENVQSYLKAGLHNPIKWIKQLKVAEEYEKEKEKLLLILTYEKVKQELEAELKDIIKNKIPQKVRDFSKYSSRIQCSNSFGEWEFLLPYEPQEDYQYMEEAFREKAEQVAKKIMQEKIVDEAINSLEHMENGILDIDDSDEDELEETEEEVLETEPIDLKAEESLETIFHWKW